METPSACQGTGEEKLCYFEQRMTHGLSFRRITLAARWRIDWKPRFWKQEELWEAVAVIQVSDDGGLTGLVLVEREEVAGIQTYFTNRRQGFAGGLVKDVREKRQGCLLVFRSEQLDSGDTPLGVEQGWAWELGLGGKRRLGVQFNGVIKGEVSTRQIYLGILRI